MRIAKGGAGVLQLNTVIASASARALWRSRNPVRREIENPLCPVAKFIDAPCLTRLHH
jgi:hypothetical protein